MMTDTNKDRGSTLHSDLPSADRILRDAAAASGVPGAIMRDAFAAITLAGMDCRGLDGEAVALRCYEVADAMMAERAELAETAE